jgi:hypothetical protein
MNPNEDKKRAETVLLKPPRLHFLDGHRLSRLALSQWARSLARFSGRLGLARSARGCVQSV